MAVFIKRNYRLLHTCYHCPFVIRHNIWPPVTNFVFSYYNLAPFDATAKDGRKIARVIQKLTDNVMTSKEDDKQPNRNT